MDKYFAIDADVQELRARIETYYQTLEDIGQAEKIRMSSYYYFNKGEFYIDRVGEKGSLSRISINDFRSLIKNLVTLVTAEKTAYKCRATNTDYTSLSQTIAGEHILAYYHKNKKVGRHQKRAVELAAYASEGFVALDWNTSLGKPYTVSDTGKAIHEGDIDYSVLDPFHVIREVFQEGEQDWVILKRTCNKYDLAARFPDQADEILMADDEHNEQRVLISHNQMGKAKRSPDHVATYLFMHRKSAVLPQGRYVLFCGDARLIDTELPYEEIPVYRIAPSNIEGTCLAYTIAFDLIALQEANDQLYSSVIGNNLSFATQCLQTEGDNPVNVSDIAHGMKLIQSEKEIKPVQLTKSAPETYELMKTITGKMQELSGINQVLRGTPSPNLRSANALALVSAQALIQNSDLIAEYDGLAEDVGTATIRLLRSFAKSPRFYSVVGKSQRSYMKQFEGGELNSIDRVTVDRSSAVSQTAAGKLEMAENLLKAGVIKRIEQYIMVLETGTYDPMIEDEVSEMMLIKQENELLSEGQPVMAIATDNHPDHAKGHKSVLANPEVRRNPALVKATLDHIQEHTDLASTTDPRLLALVGVQALPPAQDGAPQGGGQEKGPRSPTSVTMPDGTSQQDQGAVDRMEGIINQVGPQGQ
jgi:hypothetical protein